MVLRLRATAAAAFCGTLLAPATAGQANAWPAGEARTAIANSLGKRDRLVVIDVSHNTAAWRNLTPALSALLQENWHAR